MRLKVLDRLRAQSLLNDALEWVAPGADALGPRTGTVPAGVL